MTPRTPFVRDSKQRELDLQKCYILDAVCDVDEKGKPYQRAFSLKRDLERLSSLLAELKNVRLVVVDPISAYLGDADSHKNAEIRALLAPLGDLAAKHGVAVVAVSHFNKSGQQDALLRVMGSLAFVAAARAAYALVKDQNDPQRRLFLPLKNNVGRDMIGYAFTVETVRLADDIETSRIVWEHEAVTITAEEAMTPVGDAEERSEIRGRESLSRKSTYRWAGVLETSSGRCRGRRLFPGDHKASAKSARNCAGQRRHERLVAVEAYRRRCSRTPKVLIQKMMSTFGENEHLRAKRDGWEDLR